MADAFEQTQIDPESSGDAVQDFVTEGTQSAAGAAGTGKVTFMGNSIDLTALAALGSAIMIGFSCVTCNTGYYCMPFVPLILGIIGLVSAKTSVNKERTQLYSWIGVGAGGLIILALLGFFVLYIGMFILGIALSGEFS